jgi:hypothetical protein
MLERFLAGAQEMLAEIEDEWLNLPGFLAGKINGIMSELAWE